MLHRGNLARTCCALLVLALSAHAEEPTLTQPLYLDDTAERKPLMSALDSAGLAKPLDDAGIDVFGHVAGSYMYNFDTPDDDINVGRVFDFEHDEPILNQIDLTIERTVDASKPNWDAGFRVEWLYGADAGLIHSNGLFDWYDGPRDPENQFDLTQAYVDVVVPVGSGLLVRAGKFVTLLGYEVINPTGNALYSRSYLFGFAIPFTHTGVLGTYNLNDKWAVTAGITRGWEQSLEDNNDAIDFLGQVRYIASDKTTIYLNVVSGPEQPDNESDVRTVIDGIITYAATERLTLGLNGDYGWESDAASDGGNAQWYGAAGYAGYKICETVTVNGRLEWFNDDDGSRGLGTTVYEATLGLTVTPIPNHRIASNLRIRPEIRYDLADDDIFDGGTDDSQFTAGIEAYFTF